MLHEAHDSEDDLCSGCRNLSQCHPKLSQDYTERDDHTPLNLVSRAACNCETCMPFANVSDINFGTDRTSLN